MHRIGGIALILCFMLLGTITSWCEPGAEKTTQCESTVKSKPSNPSLLGRSEMQEPMPLPVIRLLRLQEIPMAACPRGLQETLIEVRSPSASARTEEPYAETVRSQQSAAGMSTRSGQ